MTSERRSKKNSAREFKNQWRWIIQNNRRYGGSITLCLLFGLLGNIFSVIASLASKNMIDIVTGSRADELPRMALILLIASVLSIGISSWMSRFTTKLTIDMHSRIQTEVFEGILEADWNRLHKLHSGDILNRFSNDVATVSAEAITWFPTLVINLVNYALIFSLIFHFDRTAALIFLASGPVVYLMNRSYLGKIQRLNGDIKLFNSQKMSFEQEVFSNLENVKAFGISGHYEDELDVWLDDFRRLNTEYNGYRIRTNIVLASVNLVGEFLSFGWVIYRIWGGYITFGEMTLILTQGKRLSSGFSSLAGLVPKYINTAASAGRIIELLELPKEEGGNAAQQDAKRGEGHESPLPQDMNRGDKLSLCVAGAELAYELGKSVLRDVSINAEPGKIIGLVSASGEGKSTIFRFLLGLLSSEKGSAFLSGPGDARVEIGAGSREYFSYVPQTPSLFSGSIAENLRLFNAGATDDELKIALRDACAIDFVNALPGGLDFELGERGLGLSAGQAQRIAIARSLLKDAPILLWDEATSALDSETERQIFENIKALQKGRTVIIATHHESVLEICDKVYRIENGSAELK